MTDAFLEYQRLYATLNGVRTNLTDYWIERATIKWGISNTKPLDLLADIGEMRFVLDNQNGIQFLPDAPSALAGWRRGTMIELELLYESETHIRFRGYVQAIAPGDGFDGHRLVYVTALDWLTYAVMYPIVNPGVLTNQRGDDVVNTVLGLITKQPAAKQLDTGVSVFPATFDTVTSKTTAYDEFSKVCRSEPGSIYLRKGKVYGETLVFENSQHWNGLKPLSTIPVPASAADTLAQEDGDLLLQEDGDTILLNEAQIFNFNNLTMNEETEHGEHVINRFTVYANPRKIDTSAQVLFHLNEPILIGSGQTIEIRGTYADPAGGLPINANPSDMITPVATTDYLVNTAQDGSGTNITSDLVLVDIVYGSEGFTHTVRNGSINSGYITKWEPRGKGIYIYNPIEHVETDQDSIASDWGTQPESMTQAYQNTLIQGTLFGRQVVFEYSQPQQILTKIHFNPNSSAELMLAFLSGDVGSYFAVTVTSKNIDEHVAVRGVEFTLDPGGFIMCTWIVKCIRTLLKGLTPIAVEFRGENYQDAIDFGHLPHLANLPLRTMTAWFNRASDSPQIESDFICGFFSDDAAFEVYITMGFKRLTFIQKYSGAGGGQGAWATANDSIAFDTLYHAVVVKDLSSDNPPVIYLNGVAQTLQVTASPPAGRTAFDESSVPFMIGNVNTATIDYKYAFKGEISDVRVYSRGLSSTEASTLYNSGTPDPDLVTDGLVFRAFSVKTKRLAQYIDQTLDEDLRVVDDVYGMVGVPHGGPIGRGV